MILPPPRSPLFPYTTLFRSLGELGAVQIARPLTEVDNALHRVLLILFFVGAGGIALGVAMGFGVARTALAPVRRFTSGTDRKSTRLNSSHTVISYAVFCLKK